MNKIECFKVRLFETDSLIFPIDISTMCPIKDVLCLSNKLSLNPTIIVADPFLFVYNDILYLFYEEKGLLTPGILKSIHTSDLKSWTAPVTVLQEPFHLSFPWVFEDNGKVYMLPETGADGSIRLYEATNRELNSFKLVKKIKESDSSQTIRMGYGDNCLLKQNGIYYLFTQLQYSDPINVLELFISNNITGPYLTHPCSPIQENMMVGRNAGSIMKIENKLIRFAQDCSEGYGDNVHILKINEISPNTYSESIIQKNVLDIKLPFYKAGGHQFNAVQFKGKWIIATDAKEYHTMFLHKIIRKLYKLSKK